MPKIQIHFGYQDAVPNMAICLLAQLNSEGAPKEGEEKENWNVFLSRFEILCILLDKSAIFSSLPMEPQKTLLKGEKKNRTLVYLFILQLIISMTMSKIINTYVDRYIVIYLLNVFNLLHWDLDSVCPGLPLCKG